MSAAELAVDAPSTEPLPVDLTTHQFTARAVGSGMVIGAALSLCNIYSGLKIGWGFNMSITAALLAFGFWRVAQVFGSRPFGLLENNVNQTAASSAAAISSAGLVAPIPALVVLTGQTLTWGPLALWLFSVCMVGVVVAVGLRRQMIVVDRLPFPSGVASARTLQEMYARGSEAVQRVVSLVVAAAVAAAVKLAEFLLHLPKLAVPGSVASAKAGSVSLFNLTFALEPSVLMVGVGAIVGLRSAVSMMLGAVVAWGVLAPWIVDLGWAATGKPDDAWFGPLSKWLLWPGVAMMVTASLTSFAFSWRSIANALRGARGASAGEAAVDTGDVRRSWFLGGLAAALVLSVVLQVALFGIGMGIAIVGVLLTFVLAVVAGRVSGETSVTPVGPMGKVTQLLFGVIAPGNPAANLMSANVTGGAASQCADLLHDMKAGWLLGAVPRLQALAQVLGALAGSLVGAAAYLVLLPDPKTQLFSKEWPAPAAAAWKGVAEIFMKGFDAMPAGAVTAMIVAGAAGVVLALAEKLAPPKLRAFVPSPASVGLAFVIPAWNSISMFLGALIAVVLGRAVPSWSAKFLIVVASGLIAGESLMGVGVALMKMLGG